MPRFAAPPTSADSLSPIWTISSARTSGNDSSSASNSRPDRLPQPRSDETSAASTVAASNPFAVSSETICRADKYMSLTSATATPRLRQCRTSDATFGLTKQSSRSASSSSVSSACRSPRAAGSLS
ncbi:hypothetical protein DLM86_01975 [Paenibacillus flagellatus]|uniref:Uncharacterized protein n=1 Tax=Paenibacillus flagellatus TaxID=2211139 RepID=A0A2V5KFI4_9BACL|nr:hypothetical protein DLM86_01975 [Paenibacillus flagellatus]